MRSDLVPGEKGSEVAGATSALGLVLVSLLSYYPGPIVKGCMLEPMILIFVCFMDQDISFWSDKGNWVVGPARDLGIMFENALISKSRQI